MPLTFAYPFALIRVLDGDTKLPYTPAQLTAIAATAQGYLK